MSSVRRALASPVRASPFVRVASVFAIAVLALVSVPRPGGAADTAASGKLLYENKCGGCHSVDRDRIGPRHRDIVGRQVATVPGYSYSSALRKLGGVWTPARLDQWLSGTQKMAPGSKMYLEMDDPAARRAIIAYLRSVSKQSSK